MDLLLLLPRFLVGLGGAISKMARSLAWVLAGFALAFGLMSCGGGGGEGGVSGGGTGGGSPGPLANSAPANSFGSVVGLGSIFVGAYEFDDAVVKVTAQDGLPVTAADLGLGVQVSVLNEKTSQTLSLNANNPTGSIQIRRQFLGVLKANGADSKIGFLNGQVVYFDRRTAVVGTATIAGLRDTLVQVAGYLEPTLNQVVVTRIEPASQAQIAQDQIYIAARVQSIDAASASVSVGFATVSLAAIQPAQAVQVNDIIRVQGKLSSGSAPNLVAAKLTKITPLAGVGGSTFRGIVYSRPTAAAPNTPLIVDGYEVQLPSSLIASLVDLRRGSLVEVRGTLDNTVLKNASLVIIGSPKTTLPDEELVVDQPIINPNGRPQGDYLIFKSPVQSVNADGSFVVRGVRVVLFNPRPGSPGPSVQVGEIISLAGEAATDAAGFYIFAQLSDGVTQ